MSNQLSSIDPTQYAAFRLVVTDGRAVLVVRSDTQTATVERSVIGDRPVMLTSSGLGDHLVLPPREKLFDSVLQTGSMNEATQVGFHQHRWPDGLPHSVWMDRDDARSVSFTMIHVDADDVSLMYQPLDRDAWQQSRGDWSHLQSTSHRLSLPRSKAASA